MPKISTTPGLIIEKHVTIVSQSAQSRGISLGSLKHGMDLFVLPNLAKVIDNYTILELFVLLDEL